MLNITLSLDLVEISGGEVFLKIEICASNNFVTEKMRFF